MNPARVKATKAAVACPGEKGKGHRFTIERFLGTEYAMPPEVPGRNQHTIGQYDFTDQVVFQHYCQDK